MRRYAQTALLFLLGGMLLKVVFTGAYDRYVRGVHLPLLVLAGLALIAVAVATLWRDIRTLGRPSDEEGTGPLRLGGIFSTAVLSAPDRTGGIPVAPDRTGGIPVVPDREATTPEGGGATPVGGPGDESADDSTVDRRALAAALAAHEGYDEPIEAGPVVAPPAGSSLIAANAPTAIFDEVDLSEPVRTPGLPAADPFRDDAGADPFRDLGSGGYEPVGGHGTRGGWALVAAALVLLVLSPPALGSYPANRAGAITLDARADLPALAAEDPVPMSLVDYTAHAAAGGGVLGERRVRLTGFVLPGPGGDVYLARLVVGCCAAGARPAKVALTGNLPGVLTGGTWVEAVGTYVPQTDRDPVSGVPIPYLSVVSVTGIDPPADPYES